MYQIRVHTNSAMLDVSFSGAVSTEEALRAISQGFALAEASSIQRAMCDLRDVTAGLSLDSFSLVAATFVTRLSAAQRIAVICTAGQVAPARHFARVARAGEELGVFTRPDDAEAWLAGVPSQRLSRTALHHLGAFETGPAAAPALERRSRRSA